MGQLSSLVQRDWAPDAGDDAASNSEAYDEQSTGADRRGTDVTVSADALLRTTTKTIQYASPRPKITVLLSFRLIISLMDINYRCSSETLFIIV